MGVIWSAPWRIDISSTLKEGENELEIEVANRWINQLLGDQQEPDQNVRTVKSENGLMGGQEFLKNSIQIWCCVSAFRHN